MLRTTGRAPNSCAGSMSIGAPLYSRNSQDVHFSMAARLAPRASTRQSKHRTTSSRQLLSCLIRPQAAVVLGLTAQYRDARSRADCSLTGMHFCAAAVPCV